MQSYRWPTFVSLLVLCLLARHVAGSEFALVPVGATGAHTINGNEIVVGYGGARVTLEVRMSDWDPDRDGDPLLRAYQVQIDSTAFTSGENGSLTLPMIPVPCVIDDDCDGLWRGCEASGFCTGTAAFRVDGSHPNFVFSGSEMIPIVDLSQPDMRLGALTRYTTDSASDPGLAKYGGTLILDVSPDAQGTFTVGFIDDVNQTFLLTDDFTSFLPSSLLPALITVTDDCNRNGVSDEQDIANGTSQDCNGNQVPDECEPDCNENDVPDGCDLANGTSDDCNDDGMPDECQFVDCNGNGVFDVCDVIGGTSDDCNANGIPDECELDCNNNDQADECDITDGTSDDTNANGVPDECEGPTITLVPVSATVAHVIDGNEITVMFGPTGGLADITMEIRVANWDFDQDGDTLLKAYQASLDPSGFTSGASGELYLPEIPIACILDDDCPKPLPSCENGVCDANAAFMVDESHPHYVFADLETLVAVDRRWPDIRLGGTVYYPSDSVLDPGVVQYAGTLALEASSDARGTFVIGFLDAPGSFLADQNLTTLAPLKLVPALITLAQDCNGNGIPDSEDITGGGSQDCDSNDVPDDCEPDCNHNGRADECDVADGTSDDCSGNGVPDECEFVDCNLNGVLDVCDIADGTSDDCDGNGIPDECEFEDCNENGVGDNCDIVSGTSQDVNADGIPDDCEPPSIALVPVAAEGVHFINGNEIGVLPGGNVVNLEIRVANWDLDQSGAPLLRGYQATIDSSGYTSGESGALAPALIPCTTDADCFGEATCGTQVSGYCDMTASAHPAAYIDAGHPDFVFSGAEVLVAVDVSEPDFRFAATPYNPADSARDVGVPQYAGTLILMVPSDASGTFTIGFLPPQDSFMADAAMPPGVIEPLGLVPALVTVISDCNDNGTLDVDDVATGTSQDCNANAFPDECDISLGGSEDCNTNGVPDECEPPNDCNGNGVQDICDVAAGTSLDLDESGVPDECEYPAPMVEPEGCRYIRITPPEHDAPLALLLTSPDYPCLSGYVAPGLKRSRLNGAPVFLTPAAWGTVHLADAAIVPGTRYEVRADYGGGLLSSAAGVRTGRWGDTVGYFTDEAWLPGDGSPDIIDVMAIIDRFKNLPTAPPVTWADLYPAVPDGVVDILDAVMGIDAFKGLGYPFDRPCP